MAATRRCGEPATRWRKSSYSEGGNCVQAGVHDRAAHVHIRDSKRPAHGLTVGAAAWEHLVSALR